MHILELIEMNSSLHVSTKWTNSMPLGLWILIMNMLLIIVRFDIRQPARKIFLPKLVMVRKARSVVCFGLFVGLNSIIKCTMCEMNIPRNFRNSITKKWQVLERLVSILEHKQVPNRTGPGVRRSKRPLLARCIRRQCSMQTLKLCKKVKLGIKV